MTMFLEFIKDPFNIVGGLLILSLLTIAFCRLNKLLKEEEVPKKYLATIVFLFILLFLTPFLVLIDGENVSIYSSWLSSLFLAFFILSLQEASTYRSNERLNNVYEEIKGVENITNAITESTIEINKLRKEIDNLTTTINDGDFSSKNLQSFSQNENSKKQSLLSVVYNYYKNK